MKIETKKLLTQLSEKIQSDMNRVESFKELSIESLNFKQGADKWSVLECVEHLNLYGDYYWPEIKNCMIEASSSPRAYFKSGIIGNYFVISMEPKEKLNTMKTFEDKNPIGSSLDKSVLDRFLNQQLEFLELIDLSKNVDLIKTKVQISISKYIKIRLGDTFRFLLAHNNRHLQQAEKVLKMHND